MYFAFKARNPQVRARLAALVSTAATIAGILGVTRFVIANRAALNGSVVVPGFLNIAFFYNRGISFSLVAQDTLTGSRVLVLVAMLVIGALTVMAYRNSRTIIGVGLGLIIGGALVNNVIDRAIHARVFDYLAVHLGAFPLFVCNAPDVAISVGVLILGVGQVFPGREAKT